MNDDELKAVLRAADPASHLVPADPQEAHKLWEEVMTEQPKRSRLPLLVAAAAAVLAGAVGVGLYSGDEPAPVAKKDPTVLTVSAGEETLAKCAPPSAKALDQFTDAAFAGTVVSRTDEEVLLTVDRWYRGGSTDQVRVIGPDARLEGLLLSVDFVEGERYLVSTIDNVVTVCGLSAAYDEDLAQLYDQAFGQE